MSAYTTLILSTTFNIALMSWVNVYKYHKIREFDEAFVPVLKKMKLIDYISICWLLMNVIILSALLMVQAM